LPGDLYQKAAILTGTMLSNSCLALAAQGVPACFRITTSNARFAFSMAFCIAGSFGMVTDVSPTRAAHVLYPGTCPLGRSPGGRGLRDNIFATAL